MKTSVMDSKELHSEREVQSGLEELYLQMRLKEGRYYEDRLVSELPLLSPDHPLSQEWKSRAYSSGRLIRYLQKKNGNLKILDLGCGNGWLTNMLSMSGINEVYGVDLNGIELAQAEKVFAANQNLHFLYADIFDPAFPERDFDLVIIASAFQYFPDPAQLIKRLFELMKDQAELHILDSPFYKRNTIEAAKERSKRYFEAVEFPGMAKFYHHHLAESLDKFQPEQKNPKYIAKIRRALGLGYTYFPWYILKSQNQ